MPTKKNIPKKKGRAIIEIDWDKVNYLLEAGCKGTEIAAYLGISEDTLYRRVQDVKHKMFADYAAEKRSKGDALLQVKQFESAIKDKNITMQIWLGKQRLGQKEKTDITSGDEKIQSTIPTIEVTLPPDVIEKLRK